MTYMSLGVVVDVTTIKIIDMIRPMIRTDSEKVCRLVIAQWAFG